MLQRQDREGFSHWVYQERRWYFWVEFRFSIIKSSSCCPALVLCVTDRSCIFSLLTIRVTENTNLDTSIRYKVQVVGIYPLLPYCLTQHGVICVTGKPNGRAACSVGLRFIRKSYICAFRWSISGQLGQAYAELVALDAHSLNL